MLRFFKTVLFPIYKVSGCYVNQLTSVAFEKYLNLIQHSSDKLKSIWRQTKSRKFVFKASKLKCFYPFHIRCWLVVGVRKNISILKIQRHEVISIHELKKIDKNKPEITPRMRSFAKQAKNRHIVIAHKYFTLNLILRIG